MLSVQMTRMYESGPIVHKLTEGRRIRTNSVVDLRPSGIVTAAELQLGNVAYVQVRHSVYKIDFSKMTWKCQGKGQFVITYRILNDS